MNFRHAMIVAGMLGFLLPILHGQTGSFAVPHAQGAASDALAASAARIAELERRIAALEQTRFTPVSGLPPASVASPSMHVVGVGDTLSGIARRYGLTVPDLEAANHLAPGAVIRTGDQLIVGGGMEVPPGPVPVDAEPSFAPEPPLPAAQPPAVQSPPQAVAAPSDSNEWTGSHTVREGETLSSIARAHGASAAELARMNGIRDANHIRVGQVLRVLGSSPEASPVASAPSPAAPTPTSGAAQPEESYYYYPVADGDTMQSVAKLFFTTPQELAKLNKISSTAVIRPGQQLVVPTLRYFEEQERIKGMGLASSPTNTPGSVETR